MSNRPTRLVLVTNNAERASIVEQVAAECGWQLLPCVRRPVPFELLDHLRIDLFLVDLELENAFDQVKELARRPGAKVIALASAEHMSNWHEAMQAGVRELISLPLDPQHLIATIGQVVNGGSSSMAGFASQSRPVQPAIPPQMKEVTPPSMPAFSAAQQQNGAIFDDVQHRAPETPRHTASPMSIPPRQQSPAVPPPMPQAPMGQMGQANSGYNQMPPQAFHQQPAQYQQVPPPSPPPYSAPHQYPGASAPQGNGVNGHGNGYPNGNGGNGFPPNGYAPQGQMPNGQMPNNQMPNGFMPNGYAPAPGNRLIAITGLRGGVGRSTIAVNLAVALRQRSNSSVILAEAHHGLGHLALLMNMLPRHTLASLTEGEAFDTDIMRSILQQHSSGVQLFSAPLDVAQLIEYSPETWREILTLLKQMAQYVVVDTSAYADSVLSEVLTAADEIVIVCGPDILSMRSTMSLLETLRAERENVRGRVQLILNRAGVRGGLDESMLQKQLREKIAVSFTDDAPLATYALNRGVPFVLSHGRSSLTRSITTLVEQYHVGVPTPVAPTKKPFALLPLLSRG